MRGRQLPRVVELYVLMSILQGVLFATYSGTHFTSGALIFEAVLLVGLCRGSRICWGILVAINSVGLLAAAGILLSSGGNGQGFGQGVEWGNVAVIFGTAVPLEAMLLTGAMRRHVGSGRGPRPLAAP